VLIRCLRPLRSLDPDNLPIALNPREGARGRALEVITTVCAQATCARTARVYSARTVVREYFDLVAVSGTPWFTVTTIIEDPEYLTRPCVTSSNFKKEADGSTWSPTACD
jgi:hypothetical protein